MLAMGSILRLGVESTTLGLRSVSQTKWPACGQYACLNEDLRHLALDWPRALLIAH
jgi:hypothetical protein